MRSHVKLILKMITSDGVWITVVQRETLAEENNSVFDSLKKKDEYMIDMTNQFVFSTTI